MSRAILPVLLLGVLLVTAAAAPPPPAAEIPWAESAGGRCYALRLRPGQDLLAELQQFARARDLRAACVVSCAGSLTQAGIRYANQPAASVRQGHFEIVSLSGTLTRDGAHLHASLADSTGATIGGHLMPGSLIYTTAEIVLAELPDVVFTREPDSTFGYRELVPKPR